MPICWCCWVSLLLCFFAMIFYAAMPMPIYVDYALCYALSLRWCHISLLIISLSLLLIYTLSFHARCWFLRQHFISAADVSLLPLITCWLPSLYAADDISSVVAWYHFITLMLSLLMLLLLNIFRGDDTLSLRRLFYLLSLTFRHCLFLWCCCQRHAIFSCRFSLTFMLDAAVHAAHAAAIIAIRYTAADAITPPFYYFAISRRHYYWYLRFMMPMPRHILCWSWWCWFSLIFSRRRFRHDAAYACFSRRWLIHYLRRDAPLTFRCWRLIYFACLF